MNLLSCTHETLEQLYASPLRGGLPSGCWLGRHLGFLQNPGARHPAIRAFDTLLFVWPSFGIDFDQRLWWFLEPRLGAGRFSIDAGPSRWRETETLRLHYDISRLPGPLRRLLYDEVKPLDDDTLLGVGGLAAGPGRGDHFFFELRRMPGC